MPKMSLSRPNKGENYNDIFAPFLHYMRRTFCYLYRCIYTLKPSPAQPKQRIDVVFFNSKSIVGQSDQLMATFSLMSADFSLKRNFGSAALFSGSNFSAAFFVSAGTRSM